MSKKLDNLSRKKLELEQNLERLQKGLDHSIGEVKNDVTKSLSPAETVRKYPLAVLGASVLLGFLAGRSPKSKSKVVVSGKRSSNSVMDAVGSTLKKKLTQKAVDTALDFIEDRLSQTRPSAGEE